MDSHTHRRTSGFLALCSWRSFLCRLVVRCKPEEIAPSSKPGVNVTGRPDSQLGVCLLGRLFIGSLPCVCVRARVRARAFVHVSRDIAASESGAKGRRVWILSRTPQYSLSAPVTQMKLASRSTLLVTSQPAYVIRLADRGPGRPRRRHRCCCLLHQQKVFCDGPS